MAHSNYINVLQSRCLSAAVHLGVAGHVVQYTGTQLQVLEQTLYVIRVVTEHAIKQRHAQSQKHIDKLTTILENKEKVLF